MTLLWKLLRQHISIAQFVGFFFANLLGMFIVLFGFQLYRDVLPIFTQSDSFMKGNYVIVGVQILLLVPRLKTLAPNLLWRKLAHLPQPIIRLQPLWALTV